jgi:hypothetical protein
LFSTFILPYTQQILSQTFIGKCKEKIAMESFKCLIFCENWVLFFKNHYNLLKTILFMLKLSEPIANIIQKLEKWGKPRNNEVKPKFSTTELSFDFVWDRTKKKFSSKNQKKFFGSFGKVLGAAQPL